MSVFHVLLTFTDTGSGPSVGTWEKYETAERKYSQWLGLYGSLPGVTLRLVEEHDARQHVLKSWPPPAEAPHSGGEGRVA